MAGTGNAGRAGYGHGQGMSQGMSETWDFSKRETFGRLVTRTIEDAYALIDERWPDRMPADGWLGPLADELTDAFMAERRAHSQAIPRWAWHDQDSMRFYNETVGNFYYWFALHFLGQYASERVKNGYRVPPRTSPPARPSRRKGAR